MHNKYEDFLALIARLSTGAGEHILNEFRKPETEIESKADSSPLTQADLRSHHHITKGLGKTGIPVVSEESFIKRDVEKEPGLFWLIDPLDGTKEFIARRNEFTVNIALVEDLVPVMGCVYVPVTGMLYLGLHRKGAYRFQVSKEKFPDDGWYREQLTERNRIRTSWSKDVLKVVASKSHLDEATSEFIRWATKKFPRSESAQYGSSLKICAIADGTVSLYPRFGPTSRWDTAAAQAVLSAAGGGIMVIGSGYPLDCRLDPILNPPFLAYADEDLLNHLGRDGIMEFAS